MTVITYIECPSATYDTSTAGCAGPSGLPAAAASVSAPSIVGGTLPTGYNGTDLGTGGVSTVPAEVFVGPTAQLQNMIGSPDILCQAPAGGGGGGFDCDAALSLAVPPYVAAGTYTAVMNIVVTGL